MACPFPCTPWSVLNYNSNYAHRRDELAALQGKIRWQIDFAASIAKIQLQAGHYFLLENPANSCAWLEDPLQRLEKDPRVYAVMGHACAHNLQSMVEPGNSSASLTGG